MQNFKEVGLSEYFDARLDYAYALFKQIEGPFNFVFSDADKEWYKNYFIDIDPKLTVGGCFTSHNISRRFFTGPAGYGRPGAPGSRGGRGGFGGPGGGVSISYKKSEK